MIWFHIILLQSFTLRKSEIRKHQQQTKKLQDIENRSAETCQAADFYLSTICAGTCWEVEWVEDLLWEYPWPIIEPSADRSQFFRKLLQSQYLMEIVSLQLRLRDHWYALKFKMDRLIEIIQEFLWVCSMKHWRCFKTMEVFLVFANVPSTF